jgi:NAD(P)-dependent dehydrogenase (short-subunit alcohol dehydrogenase family)
MNFEGKTVVITGASSGIGEALALRFAALKANVVMGARNSDKLSELASVIGSKGSSTAWTATDVSKEEDCRRLIELAVERFGGIDVLVCNAGISMRALLDDVEIPVLQRLMDVNFWGTVYCTKYALPHLQRSHGTLVGVSSVAGIHGLPGRTGYSASKYAMTGFLETVRIENLRRGLHVMVACPGFTASNVRVAALTADGSSQGETPRNEEKMMSADEVARRIIRGIARRKRFITMEFQGRATRFIKKFAPAMLDKMFYNHMAKEPDSPFK